MRSRAGFEIVDHRTLRLCYRQSQFRDRMAFVAVAERRSLLGVPIA
jgi:hypothetical protein